MTSLGIMTLSRGPYSELDKMSLFQDLKLKRRKVDSRCSSDGESIADTSTSSPDLLTPLSPKMCDQQQQSSQLHQPSPPTPTLELEQSATNNNHSNNHNNNNNNNNNQNNNNNNEYMQSQQVLHDNNGGKEHRASPDSLNLIEEKASSTSKLNVPVSSNNINVNNGNNNSSGGASVIRSIADERPRSNTPPTNNLALMNSIQLLQQHYNVNSASSSQSSSQQQHVTVLVTPSRIKSENQTSAMIGMRKQNPPSISNLANNYNNSNNNNNNNSNCNINNNNNNNHHSNSALNNEEPNRLTSTPQSSTSSASSNLAPLMMQGLPHQVQIQMFHHPSGVSQIIPRSSSSGQVSPSSSNSIFSQAQSQQAAQQQMNLMQAMQQQIRIKKERLPHYTIINQNMASVSMPPGQYRQQSPVQMSPTTSPAQSQIFIKRERPQNHTIVNVNMPSVSLSSSSYQRQQSPIQMNAPSSPMQPPISPNNHNNQNMTSVSMANSNHQRQQSPVQMSSTTSSMQQHIIIKRERQQNHTMVNQSLPNVSMSPTQQQRLQQSPIQMSPTTPPMNPALQLRHPIRDAAILFRVKNEGQLPGLMQPQHRMAWSGNQPRINGVKPEVIGGPLPPLRQQISPQQSPQHPSPPMTSQTPPRATPTVIMGESCGVRTMVWGYEPPPQSPTPTTPTLAQQAGPSQNNNNEEAAHLLLSLGQTVRQNETQPWQPNVRSPLPLNMERLWAGDYSQFPAGQQMHALNLTSQQHWMIPPGPKKEMVDEPGPGDEDDQPLVCMICEDKATGLHYGIITCEGCKGFFKRTVQNRRVYTCVADGTCEITKAQRNRCQYCRFKKCIEQGMVLQAVREDRMPGGRNSGAVYNLYKVKYKKHKKANQKAGNQKMIMQGNESKSMYLTSSTTPPIKTESINLPSHLVNGTILKTALTNPSEIVHLRHRLDNAVSSSKDRSISYDHALNMIHTLIDCDAMEDIATLPHFSEFLEDKSEIGDKLCNIGDSIVHKLVSWTKKLPFYLEIPVEIHTKLLTDKWHEILVLTTAAYQAMHGKNTSNAPPYQSGGGTSLVPDKQDPEFLEEIASHLHTLQTCLTTLMGHPISMEQLKIDVGLMVEKMTQITIMFRRIKLKMEEYVCLKVYILLNKEVELESIQERYVQVLRSYLHHTVPSNPGRLSDLLAHIPEIQTAASLLLESKMFYVPFVLNSASIR